MKKTIVFIFVFLILLSVVGCKERKKDPSVEESTSISDLTEKISDASNVPVDRDTKDTDQTNDYFDRSVDGTILETESTSSTAFQGKIDSLDKTQPTNDAGTNPANQTKLTTETESSSSLGTQITSITEKPPSVKNSEGVDLPIDMFD